MIKVPVKIQSAEVYVRLDLTLSHVFVMVYVMYLSKFVINVLYGLFQQAANFVHLAVFLHRLSQKTARCVP